MAGVQRCSECPNVLASKKSKTCSQSCRQKRSRRLTRQRKKAGEARAYPPQQKAMSDAIRNEVDDALKVVVQEELRPVVREAITADVLRAAEKLVNLTPDLVNALTEDIQQTDDKLLRQRAYTLLAKYTLGNSSIAPQPEAPDAKPMTVVFALPRPGDGVVPADATVVAPEVLPAPVEVESSEMDSDDARECMECHTYKPVSVFVGGSERCLDCHTAIQAKVRERFGEA